MEINKIHHGDCRDLFKTIPDESIDLIVTDCPYHIITGGCRIEYTGDDTSGILNRRRNYDKTDPKGCLTRPLKRVSCPTDLKSKWLKQNDKDNETLVREGKLFKHNEIKFEEWLPELYRVLKQNTHCYIMVNSRNLKDLQQKAEDVGFKFQNLCVWKKNNKTPNKYYMQQLEFILMLRKGKAKNIKDMGTSNIWEVPNIIGKKSHPTEKPVQLIEIPIIQSSNENDIVLDPFCGTGSLALACIKNKRNFICFDLDEDYVNKANERIININKVKNEHMRLFDNGTGINY